MAEMLPEKWLAGAYFGGKNRGVNVPLERKLDFQGEERS
jgi:hypothetical protein